MNIEKIAARVVKMMTELEKRPPQTDSVEELIAKCTVLRAQADILEGVILDNVEEEEEASVLIAIENGVKAIKKATAVISVVVPDKRDAGEGES